MKYRVRNKHGQLEFENFDQLKEAARTGLVEPDDEVQREDQTEWRKASAVPKLLAPADAARRVNPLVLWVGVEIAATVAALVLIRRGSRDEPEYYAFGLAIAFVVVGVLFKLTGDAGKRRR